MLSPRGMRGMDPRSMERMMKSMGIQAQPLPVKRVIFDYGDRKEVILSPRVTRVSMPGTASATYQVDGLAQPLAEEPARPAVSEDDVRLVVERTGASEDDARRALAETGDLAEAILRLSR